MLAGNHNPSSTAAHDINISRMPWPALICALVLLSGVALAWAKSRDGITLCAVSASISDSSVEGKSVSPASSGRLREGADFLNQRGSFKQVRDRLVFFTGDGNQQLIGLENLSLERVQRVVLDNPTQQDWAVSGTVTEFNGVNYLLIRRAVPVP